MSASRRFDLIVFDWDGTLFDSTRLIVRCIQSACADVGTEVPSDRDASYVIGLGLADALRHAAPALPRERYPELGARYRHHYLASQHDVVLFEGTLEMLRELGCGAERTLMVGDTTHDLQLAVNAGCASVAVSFGAHEPDAFVEFSPLHVAHTTGELHRWLAANA